MFATGITTIYKKISSITDDKQKNEAYLHLEKELTNNPYLKHQFEVMTSIKKNKDKITTQEAFNAFVKGIKDSRQKFIEENKKSSHLAFWRETKKLLEFFNINTKELNLTEMDMALDIYSSSKNLNESSIKKLVFLEKPKKVIQKPNFLKEHKDLLQETYFSFLDEKNELNLDRQFQIINFLSESMAEQTKKMFKTSIKCLMEERYKNYPVCIRKLFKLRLLAEKKLGNDFGDKEPIGPYGGAKSQKVPTTKLRYIKGLEIEAPNNWKQPEKIIIHFQIPIFPIGATRVAAMTSVIRTKDKILRLERPFLNLTVYKGGRTNLFDPVGTIWDVMLRQQVRVGQPAKASVSIYISTNKERDGQNKWEDFVSAAYDMMKEFDAHLPEMMGNLRDVLTPEVQKQDIKTVKGLSDKEKMARANSEGQVDSTLVKKRAGHQDDHETTDDDSWMDDVGIFRSEFPKGKSSTNIKNKKPVKRR